MFLVVSLVIDNPVDILLKQHIDRNRFSAQNTDQRVESWIICICFIIVSFSKCLIEVPTRRDSV